MEAQEGSFSISNCTRQAEEPSFSACVDCKDLAFSHFGIFGARCPKMIQPLLSSRPILPAMESLETTLPCQVNIEVSKVQPQQENEV